MFKQAHLFYFTGTGNTLALTKAAADALRQQGITVDIASVQACPDEALPELIGIFFPVYSYGAPRIVNRFVKRLPSGEGRSAFVIANAADSAGAAATELGAALAKRGYKVLLADWVKMPSNYILGRGAIEQTKAAEIIAAGESKVKDLCNNLTAPDFAPAPLIKRNGVLHSFAHWAFLKGLKYAHKYYRVTDKCTGCGACVEMCPTGSISFTDKERPTWSRGCEHCLRCLNLCPAQAIEFAGLTKGKRRFTYWKGHIN